jgi:hypothetical protein
MRKNILFIPALMVLTSACLSSGPQSVAKFVKMPQDAPKGKVSASAATGINIPDEGDNSLSGFGAEAYMSRFDESYDWSVGVSNGALFYDANLNLVTGKTRLGLLHGLGLTINHISGGDDAATNGSISPTAGVFFQHSLSSLKHVYGSARFTYSRQFTSADTPDGYEAPDAKLLGLNLGYAIMDGTQGLGLAPEFILSYRLDEGDTAIGLGLTLSANFL